MERQRKEMQQRDYHQFPVVFISFALHSNYYGPTVS